VEREDLTATHFITTRLVVLFVGALGVFFLFQPSWLGWDWFVERFGETRVLSVGIGVALLLVASLSFEKNTLRVRVAEVFVALNQLLYGRNYKAEREMIETLVLAMESGDAEKVRTSHKHLVRLTGQNLAADPQVWRSWWNVSRKRFEVQRGTVRKTGSADDDSGSSNDTGNSDDSAASAGSNGSDRSEA
jgi:hypothetical protein